MKQITAFLDIDETLIFGAQSNVRYNDNLIDTLLQYEITDVYLFSSMSLKEEIVSERKALIDYLTEKGLTVHGVICSSDLLWNKKPMLLNDFHEQILNEENSLNDLLALLDTEKFEELKNFDDVQLGAAFRHVDEGKKIWDDAMAQKYVIIAGMIIRGWQKDEANPALKNEKACIYKNVIAKNWANKNSDIIFIDDNTRCIEGVSSAHETLPQRNYHLLTILNKEGNCTELSKHFYEERIGPFVDSVFSLFRNVASYASGRRFTYSKAKYHILEAVQENLDKCRSLDDIEAVENHFTETYNDVLNHHRYRIWSNSKTRSARTFDHMIAACREKFSDEGNNNFNFIDYSA